MVVIMVENIKRILEQKYGIVLDEFAIYDAHVKKNHTFMIGGILFAILLLLFILGENNLLFQIDFIYVVFGLFVLVLIPLALNKKTEYRAIIVTPEALIQRTGKNTFAIVPFDDITAFDLTEHGIIIKGNGEVIALSLSMFREEIEPIIDILEAKGKTFEKGKEYMVRPIKIEIHDNTITIKDIDKKTKTDLVYEGYVKRYTYLTPGYLNEVMLRNCIVENISTKEDTIDFKLANFTIKEGHPENTHFDAIEVSDGILIFTKFKIKQIVLENSNDEKNPKKTLDPSVKNITKHVEDGVISDWDIKNKTIFFDFASGVHSLKVELAFDEAIVGWNKIK